MARIPLAIVLLLAVLATLASASVPSFCKCTCFQNSTIIPLGPQHDNNNNNNQPAPPPPKKPSPSSNRPAPSSPTSPSDTNTNTNPNPSQSQSTTLATTNPLHALRALHPRESSTSCKQCNRAFCLKYNLPICKDAEEKDIKTSCFQRDSPKDRVIVWGFILGTAGLLGWAALRRVIDSARERRRQQQQQGGGGGMGIGGGRFGGFGGLMGGGAGRGGNSGRGFSAVPGGGADREVYDPLQDGHDEGVTRGPG
ncbi:uncharacterized protein B0H64DRAFT_406574 [Chaetomium fimeti]|uniref:Uncharacterized protein n=1 Tax=Chaetomium fimeti TaxID=1854472 RepID=A0AAE0H9E2_9PEZI|nr:hypothetical protein B0H64DRAFT_406574 [Chaetomium fimeti]